MRIFSTATENLVTSPDFYIAVGSAISFVSKAYYSDYDIKAPIGEQDHAFLFANIEVR